MSAGRCGQTTSLAWRQRMMWSHCSTSTAAAWQRRNKVRSPPSRPPTNPHCLSFHSISQWRPTSEEVLSPLWCWEWLPVTKKKQTKQKKKQQQQINEKCPLCWKTKTSNGFCFWGWSRSKHSFACSACWQELSLSLPSWFIYIFLTLFKPEVTHITNRESAFPLRWDEFGFCSDKLFPQLITNVLLLWLVISCQGSTSASKPSDNFFFLQLDKMLVSTIR